MSQNTDSEHDDAQTEKIEDRDDLTQRLRDADTPGFEVDADEYPRATMAGTRELARLAGDDGEGLMVYDVTGLNNHNVYGLDITKPGNVSEFGGGYSNIEGLVAAVERYAETGSIRYLEEDL